MTTGAAASPSTALTSEALSPVRVPRRPEISKTVRKKPRAGSRARRLSYMVCLLRRLLQLAWSN